MAEQLGFPQHEVVWTVVPFNKSFKPGPKNFDFDINQISFTPAAREGGRPSATRTTTCNQAVVALKGTPIANATSVADLKDVKLGAQVGTTSYDHIVDNIQPSQDPPSTTR